MNSSLLIMASLQLDPKSRSDSPLGRGRTLSSQSESLKNSSPLRSKSIMNLTWKERNPSISPLRREKTAAEISPLTFSRPQARAPIFEEKGGPKPNKENTNIPLEYTASDTSDMTKPSVISKSSKVNE